MRSRDVELLKAMGSTRYNERRCGGSALDASLIRELPRDPSGTSRDARIKKKAGQVARKARI